MSASPPTWKRGDTYPPYAATLQQAGGASVLPLTAASQVELIAKNTGASTTSPTSVLIRGIMSIASPALGYVTYSWGASDLILSDVYNVEYEISWSAGGTENVPNDSYDTFAVFPDLEGS